ncbi:hypothetical protein I0D00_10025 [Pseudomonas lalucatii]|uniref:Uncharacterized protein n=1 Tax=Pseudomonas lalucatii TaxID=1424203 RepID=A0ABS5Q0J8_9PSED|nr:hypothetical protein [Pseudomonas lalucatii]MBS7662272.1 hypothetical protein [Pseudomonas lalucatii]MBS7690381.1 hypothetical protein [Pseudomonas lalucatii]MBS7726014.1 hypothetical protein [Pseudomonas lalucatii]QVM88406.1 hypothetical protein I0D68_07175 [Pseudomonas lalucatii]
MQLRLTRNLIAGLLLAGGLLAGPLSAAEPAAVLSGAEQERYLSELKRLYLTQDERQALLAHSNGLLETYALSAAYQVGQAQRQDLRYQLRLGAPGELLLREETRGAQGSDLAVRNQRLALFGVDPFIRYDCPPAGISCVLFSPADGSPLLSIVRDHRGAAELAKALSFLIRNLQKG